MINPTRKTILVLLAGATISLAALFGTSGHSLAQTAQRLPPIEAYDLTGAPRRIPSGLPTEITLLIVAFDRNQQPAADRLFKLIDEAGAAKQGIATIETPVIQDPGGPRRFFIDNGMRLGIRDTEKQKVVVTLYVSDLAAWLTQTGLGTKETVHLMAVNRSGRILRAARAETIADVNAMRTFVAQSMKRKGN